MGAICAKAHRPRRGRRARVKEKHIATLLIPGAGAEGTTTAGGGDLRQSAAPTTRRAGTREGKKAQPNHQQTTNYTKRLIYVLAFSFGNVGLCAYVCFVWIRLVLCFTFVCIHSATSARRKHERQSGTKSRDRTRA